MNPFARLARRRGGRDDRESLLFISPVVPALFGNGLAMRAAQTVLAFATRYHVTLLVLPAYGSPAGHTVPDAIRTNGVRAAIAGGSSDRPYLGERFDIIHLFRLRTIAAAEPWLAAAGVSTRLWLDLDDVESIVHRRLAALHRELCDEPAALGELEMAARAESQEVAALMRFDRVYLASSRDQSHLPLQDAADVRWLPNVLPLPGPLPEPDDEEPDVILFVGTLGYLPNVEGALWFAREVLPKVQRNALRSVAFHVVGMGWLSLVEELRRLPGVTLIGPAPDVRPHYQRARLVVVPVRAGGGTRIKLIEAFGLGRAVVATTIGVEGIEAVADRELVIADDEDAFADACLRLLETPTLRHQLARSARELAQKRYSPEAAAEIVARLP